MRASKLYADISKKPYRQKILPNIFESIFFFFINYVDDVPAISKTIMVIAMNQIVFKRITVAIIMQNTSTKHPSHIRLIKQIKLSISIYAFYPNAS